MVIRHGSVVRTREIARLNVDIRAHFERNRAGDFFVVFVVNVTTYYGKPRAAWNIVVYEHRAVWLNSYKVSKRNTLIAVFVIDYAELIFNIDDKTVVIEAIFHFRFEQNGIARGINVVRFFTAFNFNLMRCIRGSIFRRGNRNALYRIRHNFDNDIVRFSSHTVKQN